MSTRDCVYVHAGGIWTCTACGDQRRQQVKRNCPQAPTPPPVRRDPPEATGNCCQPPPLTRRVCSATAAGLKFAAAGFPVLDATQAAARVAVCQGDGDRPPCLYYAAGVCNDCGCCVELKATMQTEDCPRGFWPTK